MNFLRPIKLKKGMGHKKVNFHKADEFIRPIETKKQTYQPPFTEVNRFASSRHITLTQKNNKPHSPPHPVSLDSRFRSRL